MVVCAKASKMRSAAARVFCRQYAVGIKAGFSVVVCAATFPRFEAGSAGASRKASRYHAAQKAARRAGRMERGGVVLSILASCGSAYPACSRAIAK